MTQTEREWITRLEKDLEGYSKVFLIFGCNEVYKGLFEEIDKSERLQVKGQNVLLLSAEEIPEGKNYTFRRLSFEEAVYYRKLYFMYEFSEKFKVLPPSDIFGSLINFVDTGILTQEEAFEVLLY